MNLGKYDFFPRASGKGNSVAFLQRRFGVAPAESVCLFDDDNDLPMAAQCAAHYLPGLTSDSVRAAAAKQPSWRVASKAGQGVFAIEECLEEILERVRSQKTGRVPRLIVFDLDACLWSPEMFELGSSPTTYDAAQGGVRAGRDVVKLF